MRFNTFIMNTFFSTRSIYKLVLFTFVVVNFYVGSIAFAAVGDTLGTISTGGQTFTILEGGSVIDKDGNDIGVITEQGVFTGKDGSVAELSEVKDVVISTTLSDGTNIKTINDGHTSEYIAGMHLAATMGAQALAEKSSEMLADAIKMADSVVTKESSGNQTTATIIRTDTGYLLGCTNVQGTTVTLPGLQNTISTDTGSGNGNTSGGSGSTLPVSTDPIDVTDLGDGGGGSNTHPKQTLQCADWDGSVYGIPEGFTEGTFIVGGNSKNEKIAVNKSGCSAPDNFGNSSVPIYGIGSISASARIVPVGTRVDLTINTGGQICTLKYGNTSTELQSPTLGVGYGDIVQTVTVMAKTTYTLSCPSYDDVTTTIEVKPRVYES